MSLRHWVIAAAALLMGGAPVTTYAGAAPEEAFSVLQKRGYTAIEIAPSETPGYQASACKGGTRFAITLDPQSNIVDMDPRGSCGDQQEKYAAAPPPEMQGRGGYKGGGDGAGSSYGDPDNAFAPLLAKLYRKGFYNLRIVDVDDDEIEVLACRKRRLFKIDVRRRSGRIDDIDNKGRCGPRRRAGNDDVNIEAPFTGVHVGRDEVRIRAPFVDLRIPR